MATLTVGINSRNYSTLQAAEDALPATFTTPNIIDIYPDAEYALSNPLVIAGITTDSTNTLTVRAAAGGSYNDHASKSTNRYAYDASKGVAIRATNNYAFAVQVSGVANVILDGLQTKVTGANSQGIWSNGANTLLRNCIVHANLPVSTDFAGIHIEGASSKAVNCLVVADTASACSGIFLLSGASAYNCTVVRPSNYAATGLAIKSNYGTATIRNCALFGFTGLSGTFAADGHNVTDMATAPGATGNLTGKVYASQFVQTSNAGAVEDFRAKAGADLIGAGVRDAANTADLDALKRARSTTAPTVGATEYIVAGGGAVDTPVNPGNAAVTLTGYAPTVARTASLGVTPAAASLLLTGYAPSVTQSAASAITPAPAALTLTGYAPTVARTASLSVSPAPGQHALTGFAPTVTQAAASANLTPASAAVALTGFAPTITQGIPAAPAMPTPEQVVYANRAARRRARTARERDDDDTPPARPIPRPAPAKPAPAVPPDLPPDLSAELLRIESMELAAQLVALEAQALNDAQLAAHQRFLEDIAQNQLIAERKRAFDAISQYNAAIQQRLRDEEEIELLLTA